MPYEPNRLDGFAEWEQLPPSVQVRIGAIAIELVATWVGLNAAFCSARETTVIMARAFTVANAYCRDHLLETVSEAVPAIDPARPPLPRSVGEICAYCGRHRDDCRGEDCSWVGATTWGADGDNPAGTDIPWIV